MKKDRLETDLDQNKGEDAVHSLDQAAWVLDGATSLTDHKLSGSKYVSDGQWYVNQVNDYFKNNINNTSHTLKQHAYNAVKTVREKYKELGWSGNLPPRSLPCATVGILRWKTEQLEYYVLGDSRIEIKLSDKIITIGSTGGLDKQAIDRLSKVAKQKNIPPVEAINEPEILSLLQENRDRLNKYKGYWVLGLDPDATYNGFHGSVSNVDKVLAMTDGFWPVVDDYNCYNSWESLFKYLNNNHLDSVTQKLRNTENHDPHGRKMPRFKKHDDAAAVYVSFE